MVEGGVWGPYLGSGPWKASRPDESNRGWDGLSYMEVLGVYLGVCFHLWLVYLRVHFL
jgi:hypothetical protein